MKESQSESTKNARKISIILNESSGGDKKNDRSQEVIEAFANLGMTAEIEELSETNTSDAIINKIQSKGCNMVVAGGGDGTISSVAGAIVRLKSSLTLGLLPMGTLNHFTKDLGIPQQIPEAAKIIAEEYSEMLDIGEVNGAYFINNSSIGAYPMVVLDREAQERKGGSKWPSLVRASFHALREFDTFEATIEHERKKERKETPLIFVGNDRYVMQGSEMGTRKNLKEGTLTVLVTRKSTRLRLFLNAILARIGRVRDAADLDIEHVPELTIRLTTTECEVSLDGEVQKIKCPLHYRSVPAALRVIVPRTKIA